MILPGADEGLKDLKMMEPVTKSATPKKAPKKRPAPTRTNQGPSAKSTPMKSPETKKGRAAEDPNNSEKEPECKTLNFENVSMAASGKQEIETPIMPEPIPSAVPPSKDEDLQELAPCNQAKADDESHDPLVPMEIDGGDLGQDTATWFDYLFINQQKRICYICIYS